MEYKLVTPEAIKEYRQANKLSQQDLASMLGVGISTIKRWEKGTIEPTGTAAAILNTTMASFLGADDDVTIGSVAGSSVSRSIFHMLKGVFEDESTRKVSQSVSEMSKMQQFGVRHKKSE